MGFIMHIGVDIVEISRVRFVLNKWGKRFLDRIYTSREQKEQESISFPAAYLAGRWAAKEAIMKAIGSPCSWTDLEITKGGNGKPEVTLLNKTSNLYGAGNPNISLSISHSKEYAVATALLSQIPAN